MARSRSRRGARPGFDRPRVLWVVTLLVLVLLYLPLGVVFLYSFNSSNSLVSFAGFSLRWYRSVFENGDMLASLWVSVQVAVVTTVASVLLGTLLAFGVVRGLAALGRPAQAAVFLRVVTPETATGVALLLMFTQLGFTLSNVTLVLAHVSLCVAFVTVVVTSRLTALNEEVEDAAMDLGATRLQAVWLVAVPALRPAILASGLLSFVLSFDNFITSFFTSGIGVPPLPVRIYSMIRYGVSPEVNAIGACMLVITVVVILAALAVARVAGRRRPRPYEKEAVTIG
jgi:ABC-type spermidine/putrescine transport system permease subunit II